MERLAALSKELGSPGHLALYIAARKRGIIASRTQVPDFASKQGERQVFSAVQPSAGKTVDDSEFARFQADLIDMENDAGTPGERVAKDILVVVNVLTRQIYARAMRMKTAVLTNKP